MVQRFEQPELRLELIEDLRRMAARGAKVRDLVRFIHTSLDYPEPAVVPVLAYMTRAFKLPLITVLPIREWLGTEEDSEIDALILPAIEKNKELWLPTVSKAETISRGGEHGI